MSTDENMRHRLQEKVDEADFVLRIQKSKGKSPQWASASLQLAEALTALAIEEDDRDAFARYEQAIAAYNQALEIFTGQEHLSEWGGAVVSFARSLRSYASREGGHMSLIRLGHAKRLLGDVIKAMPAPEGLFDIAMLHIELAYVYRTTSSIDREEKRPEHLQEAIGNFEKAASILRIKEDFDKWASAVIGQAIAWRDMAGLNRTGALPALQRASELLKTVLGYYTPATHPVDWIFSHFEYGRIWLRIAIFSQGEQCHDAANHAISALRTALEFIVMDNMPDLWVRLHTELALALTTLAAAGAPEEAIKSVAEAVQLYRRVAEWYESQDDAINASLIQADLGKELGKLAALEQGSEQLGYRLQAVEALRKSVPPLLEQEMPDNWLTNMFELSAALHTLLQHHEPPEEQALYREATAIYHATLRHMNAEKNPVPCAMVQSWLGLALVWLGERNEKEVGMGQLREAELCFRRALTLRNEKEDTGDFIRLENNLGNLFYTMARRSPDGEAQDYCDQALRSILRARSLTDAQQNPGEWCNIQSNYAMILLHRVRRGLAPDIVGECELAEEAFCSALASADGTIGLVSQLFLRRNRAFLLSIWAKHLPVQKAWMIYERSHAQLNEIREIIKMHDIRDMEDLVSDQDIEEAAAAVERCRPRKPLERLMEWLF